MNKVLLDITKKNLESIDQTTTWVFLTLVVLYFSFKKDDENIKIGGIEIPSKISGLILFSILCALNFSVLRDLNNLAHILKITSEKGSTIELIKYHSWIFNPFTETSGSLSYFTDNLGIPLLLFIWWFGFISAQRIFLQHESDYGLRGYLLFLFYLLLGLLTLVVIIQIFALINPSKTKIYFSLGGILFGYLLSFILFKPLLNYESK